MNPATKVSGYVNTPTPKKCGTCIHLSKGHLCDEDEVLKDKELTTDKESGLKEVDAENGCCNSWQEPQRLSAGLLVLSGKE